ncbi:uncharacterized protein TRIADDRAFT_54945 [Trichoplax adhaerens]|uniref:Protein kinase domain-containing protein n=1 Tax=Trichoplax adhaerens TaxID=10228 RepID=B3RTF3_TRIAD|nr:predicted protein [Trichoplax adhaerens]EDV26686.1 predicted protein [Trichoplax adhaerens]|eukprot:XP_002110682.1 predicted protein [Trichoplax adhaerens]
MANIDSEKVKSLLDQLEAAKYVDEIFDIADEFDWDIDDSKIEPLRRQAIQNTLKLLPNENQNTYQDEIEKLSRISVDDNTARSKIKILHESVERLVKISNESSLIHQREEYEKNLKRSDNHSTLEDFKYPVLVTGETSAGKSSLLNYLLGIELLSTHTLSCTNKICEIRYGEMPKIDIINADSGDKISTNSWPLDSKDSAIKEIRSLTTDEGLFGHLNKASGMKEGEDPSNQPLILDEDVSQYSSENHEVRPGEDPLTHTSMLDCLSRHPKQENNITAHKDSQDQLSTPENCFQNTNTDNEKKVRRDSSNQSVTSEENLYRSLHEDFEAVARKLPFNQSVISDEDLYQRSNMGNEMMLSESSSSLTFISEDPLQHSDEDDEMIESKSKPNILIRIHWPSKFLKGGMQIVDSPGIGEKENIPKVLKKYIYKAVAYVIVIDSGNAGGIQEGRLQNLLQEISGVLGKDGYSSFESSMAVFVCNKWDTVPFSEREEVKNDSLRKLKRCWPTMVESQVIFLSTKILLEARAYNPDALILPEAHRLFDKLIELIPISRKRKLFRFYRCMIKFVEEVQETCWCYLLKANSEDYRKQICEDQAKEYQLLQKTHDLFKTLEADKNKLIDDAITKYLNLLKCLNFKSIAKWSEKDLADKEFEEDNLRILQEHAAKKIRNRLNTHLQSIGETIHNDLWSKNDSLIEEFNVKLDEIFHLVVPNSIESTNSFKHRYRSSFDLDERVGYSNFSELHGFYDLWADIDAKKRTVVILTSPVWVAPVVIASSINQLAKSFRRKHKQEEIQTYKKKLAEEMRMKTLEYLEDISSEEFARKFIFEKINSFTNTVIENVKISISRSLNSRIKAAKIVLEDKCTPREINKIYRPIEKVAEKLHSQLRDFYSKELAVSSVKFNNLRGYDEKSTAISLGLKVNLYRASIYISGKEIKVIIQVPVKKSMREMHDFTNNCNTIMARSLESTSIAKFLGICHSPNVTAIGIFENSLFTLEDLILYDQTLIAEADMNIIRQNDPDVIRLMKIFSMVYQIIEGIKFLHENELIHAHLTLGNILVYFQADRLKLKLCHLMKNCVIDPKIDFEKSILHYLAPEVLKDRKCLQASDIYSFAVLFWEIWHWKSIPELFSWNINTDPGEKVKDLFETNTLIPKLHKDLYSICFDSFAVNPKERPDIFSWYDTFQMLESTVNCR